MRGTFFGKFYLKLSVMGLPSILLVETVYTIPLNGEKLIQNLLETRDKCVCIKNGSVLLERQF